MLLLFGTGHIFDRRLTGHIRLPKAPLAMTRSKPLIKLAPFATVFGPIRRPDGGAIGPNPTLRRPRQMKPGVGPAMPSGEGEVPKKGVASIERPKDDRPTGLIDRAVGLYARSRPWGEAEWG